MHHTSLVAVLEDRTGPRVLAHRRRQHALSQSVRALVVLVVVANAAVAVALAAGLLPLDSTTVQVRPAEQAVVSGGQRAPGVILPMPAPTPLPPAPNPPGPMLLPLAPLAPAPVADTEPLAEDRAEEAVPLASARTVAWVQPSNPATTPPLAPAPASARAPAPALQVQQQPPAPEPTTPAPAPEPELPPPPVVTPTPPPPPEPPAPEVEIILTAGAGPSEHELTFSVPAGTYAFDADLLVFVAGQRLSVTLDGQDEGTWTSEGDGPDWVRVELLEPTQLEEGEHTLRVSGTSDDGVRLESVVVTDATP